MPLRPGLLPMRMAAAALLTLIAAGLAARACADILVSTGTTDDSSRVVRYTDDGRYLGAFVCPGNDLSVPRGMAIGLDGRLLVASFANGRVLSYDATSGEFRGVFVQPGAGSLRNPERILLLGTQLLVTDFHAGAVRRYDAGTGAALPDLVPDGLGGLGGADDMIVGPDGMLYVSSAGTGEVLRYDLAGTFDRVFASGGGMIVPRGLAFDSNGKLLVDDSGANRIVRFNPDGTVDATFTPGAPLEGPRALILDPDGKLLLANQYGTSVLRYAADGTLAGELSSAQRPDREPAFLMRATGMAQMRARMLCPPDQAIVPGADVVLTYCLRNVGCATETFHYAFADSRGWLVSADPAASGDATLLPNGEFCVTITLRAPANTPEGETSALSWEAYPAQDTEGLDRCITTLTASAPTPVLLSRFQGEAAAAGVRLWFSLPDERGLAGVEIYRADAGGAFERINPERLRLDGRGEYEWTDTEVRPGLTYRYQLGLVETGGQETRMGLVRVTVPALAFALGRPGPSPTDRGFTVRIGLPTPATARLRILDLGGRVVRSLIAGPLPAGERDVRWDGRGPDGRVTPSGIYFLVFESGAQRRIERFVVMR